MSDNPDRSSLYTQPILAAARAWENASPPDEELLAEVTVNNPFCGDRISGWLAKCGDELELGLSLDTCLICRASACLLMGMWDKSPQVRDSAFPGTEIWSSAPDGLSAELMGLYWALRKPYDANIRKSCIELPWRASEILLHERSVRARCLDS